MPKYYSITAIQTFYMLTHKRQRKAILLWEKPKTKTKLE